ncbi:hypothetical protein LCGC14_2939690, partial [marine sediment metagenome]
MLYSSYRGAVGSFRGKTWKLTNGYWRACNYNGQQCTFKIYNEAMTFANKGKPISENKEITLQAVRTRYEAAKMAKDAERMTTVVKASVKELRNGQFQPVLTMKEVHLDKAGYVLEGRVRSYYMPELRKREMVELAARLVKQGYKADVRGPNLRTDASEKYVRSIRTTYPDDTGARKKSGWSHGSKSMGEQGIREAKSSFTLHAMGNGWSHSKTISANSQKEAESMFRNDPRFRRQ